MDDGSRGYSVRSLKNEWNLFWESLFEEKKPQPRPEPKDPLQNGKIENLNLDQLRAVTRSLSVDRKQLNQQMEKLHKEIELNALKLESLRLVGSPDRETLSYMSELAEKGQHLADSMEKLDKKLRAAYVREEILLAAEAEL